MGIFKGKFRVLADGQLLFWCPGCKEYHGIYVDKNKPVHWDFNGDYDKPTLSPSVLVTTGHYIAGHTGKCWCDYQREHPNDKVFGCSRCHSFIRDGKIQYLSDCTHELAGQTVEMQDKKEE